MAAQAELLDRFRSQVVQVFQEMGEPVAALKKIKEKLKELPRQDIDWAKFDAEFTQAHPEFRAKLMEQFPDMTAQELKLCIMLRLGLKSHEAARLLALSERTIEKHRENIRRKIGVKNGESLRDVLKNV